MSEAPAAGRDADAAGVDELVDELQPASATIAGSTAQTRRRQATIVNVLRGGGDP